MIPCKALGCELARLVARSILFAIAHDLPNDA
jgi:hypothetical protein